ncbi:hypothetical protein B0H17DRAFT_1040721 [Mycena rosella]|uniref:Uncharacterized protein n=1 Tax=Mycena rosella TaxID=1033263 RepID=A0AAD7DZQ6_MYCRO|nr:hypothetical protein B0H17DRAFT_1040721 [Mycena rosella]
MRLALYFLILGAFAGLSFVSALRNVTLDDNHPSIIYSSGWNVSNGNNSLDFGGSLHFSDNSSASATLTFQGVAIYLVAPFWSSRVGMQVAIDGQGPFTIDLEDYGVPTASGLGRETLQSQIVWVATALPDAQHTIVISMPPAMRNLVLDGLIYSVFDGNNAESVSPVAVTSTSSRFNTITTTKPFTSSSSSSSVSSFFVHSTPTSSSQPHLASSSTSSPPIASAFTAPMNVATAAHSSAAGATVSVTPAATVMSASVKRSIAISSVFGTTMLLLLVLVILTCLRRRRMHQRRKRLNNWSQKFTPYPSHASRIAFKPPPPQPGHPPRSPAQHEHSPATALPLLPPAPPARRMPRSPLATAAPIMPQSPSPTASQFPPPPAALISMVLSPVPATPLPETPLPPVTPGTPWSTQKSRFSSSSVYSYVSSSSESGAGYGWTTPSLVGIHPFSAPAEPEPSASRSRPQRPTEALSPKLDEKSAAALFRAEGAQRASVAPAYREKDATRLFVAARGRARSSASETAPPVYQP